MSNKEFSSTSSILNRLKTKSQVNEKRSTQLKTNAKGIKIIDEEWFELVATCMQNFEAELADELRQLGAKEIEVLTRAVKFKADLKLLYEANIWLRTAIKIIKPVFRFTAKNEEELYAKAVKLPWEKIFSEEKTFEINTAMNSPHFNHSHYISLKLKDAIVDRFRNMQLNRPNVDRNQADVGLQLHINGKFVTVSIDSSGKPLFKRGYRVKQHRAPINECLAAGMILKSGWKGEVDLLDPMCGSATIAIEAALIATNIPPNLNRTHFAFEEWDSYDSTLFSKVLGEAKNHYRPLKVSIYARELNNTNLKMAQLNINEAHLRKSIQLEQADFFTADPPLKKGIIIMNPPYGERMKLDDGLSQFFAKIGSTLKHTYSGWEAWIISSEIESFKSIGLKPSKKIPLMNGKLDCQFRKYELFDGKRSEKLAKKDLN